MIHLPESYLTTVNAIWGPAGASWVESLDQTVALLAAQWGLSQIVLFPQLSYCVVARALTPQGPVVLKLCFDDTSIRRESLALTAYAGKGAVRLLAFDLDRAALLLEYLDLPGRSLETTMMMKGLPSLRQSL